MSYLLERDGPTTTIRPVEETPDGYEVFETFAEAKREALAYLREQRDSYKLAIKQMRALGEREVVEAWA